jgi:hypothetical protein
VRKMFWLTYNEKGPRVVLVQTLLRLKNIDVKINGIFNQDCLKGVMEYRKQLGMHPMGPVDGKVFINLIQNTKLKVIDSIDASGGGATEAQKRELLKTGVSKPLMNERLPGRGVVNATEKILERAKDHRIGLLRLHGHGNEGTWVCVALGDPYHLRKSGKIKEYQDLKADWKSYIDYSHFERHKETLAQIAPLFASFASVELNSCTIAKQSKLIQKLANTWGVPVSGGKDLQNGGGFTKNQYGEWVPHAFSMEGEVFTAYPNNGDLQNWAAGVESSVPNLKRWFTQIKENFSAIITH